MIATDGAGIEEGKNEVYTGYNTLDLGNEWCNSLDSTEETELNLVC